MFGRKRIRQLEIQNQSQQDQIANLTMDVNALRYDYTKNIRAKAAALVLEQLHASQATLLAEIRVMVKNVVRELPCSHGRANSTILAIKTFHKDANLPPILFGDLITIKDGVVQEQQTCYTLDTSSSKEPIWVIYARICHVCGQLSPVTWFDIAAAGSAVQIRNVRSHAELLKYTPLESSRACSTLDAAIASL